MPMKSSYLSRHQLKSYSLPIILGCIAPELDQPLRQKKEL